ncbi:hypothetical protein, partial [Brevibacillus brevis]|uniref:hypothetical protein n=1 Tax=Brevibacillus brevis TaxID=1393 RepID=UPI0037CBA3B1
FTSNLDEPPYTERYVRWCERTGASHPLLLDYIVDQAQRGKNENPTMRSGKRNPSRKLSNR